MRYAILHHGSVLRFLQELPFTYLGVRVRELPVAELAKLGIVPVEDQTPAFDVDTHYVVKAPLTITVQADRVVVQRRVERMTPEVKARQVVRRS